MSTFGKIFVAITGMLLLLPGLCGAVFAITTIAELIFGNGGSDMDITGAVTFLAPLGLLCGAIGIWLIRIVYLNRTIRPPE